MKVKEIRLPHMINYSDLAFSEEDPKVMKNFEKGNCLGIFQFENSYAQDILRSMDNPKIPMTIEDVSAVSALIRPGPLSMGMPQIYADRRNGAKPVEYIHPVMKQFTDKTFGVIVYQEQVMQIIAWFLGRKKENFDELISKNNWKDAVIPNLIEGDHFRKFVKKFDANSMKTYEDKFSEAGVDKKIPKVICEKIFELIFKFASYGFNACLDENTNITTTLGKQYKLIELFNHKDNMDDIIVKTEDGEYLLDGWEMVKVERKGKIIEIEASGIKEADKLII